ncbi:MAG: hypothetical protein IJV07_01775 [Alphaproteobacteria bacterium]|nr:hypothetical protein [Alphaproteobacteria bacterium]
MQLTKEAVLKALKEGRVSFHVIGSPNGWTRIPPETEPTAVTRQEVKIPNNTATEKQR